MSVCTPRAPLGSRTWSMGIPLITQTRRAEDTNLLLVPPNPSPTAQTPGGHIPASIACRSVQWSPRCISLIIHGIQSLLHSAERSYLSNMSVCAHLTAHLPDDIIVSVSCVRKGAQFREHLHETFSDESVSSQVWLPLLQSRRTRMQCLAGVS